MAQLSDFYNRLSAYDPRNDMRYEQERHYQEMNALGRQLAMQQEPPTAPPKPIPNPEPNPALLLLGEDA